MPVTNEAAAVVANLAENLSALRTGLSTEAQDLLDAVVANSEFDVSGHMAVARAVPQNAAISAAKVNSLSAVAANQADDDIEDVVAHAVQPANAVQPSNVIALRYSSRSGYIPRE